MHIHTYNLLPLAVVAHIWMAIFFYSKQARPEINLLYTCTYIHTYMHHRPDDHPLGSLPPPASRGSPHMDGNLLLL